MKIAQIAPIIERVPPKKYGGTERVISLLTTDGGYSEYCSPSGQLSCRQQAWSAAAILDMTSEKNDIINLG